MESKQLLLTFKKKKLAKRHPVIPDQAAAAYPFSCLVTKLDTVAFLLLLTFHVKQVVKAAVNILSFYHAEIAV